MNSIKIFEGNEVEILELNGKLLFNPYDVGTCLGLSKSVVRSHLVKMNNNQTCKLTNSVVQKMDIRKLNNRGERFLTESGVYKLAFRSNKPNAEKFTDWVADEVLPSIRKTGKYEMKAPRPEPKPTLCEKIEQKSELWTRILKDYTTTLTILIDLYDFGGACRNEVAPAIRLTAIELMHSAQKLAFVRQGKYLD